MKAFGLLVVFIFSLSSSGEVVSESLESLKSLRWEYRIVLVNAKEPLASNAVANLEQLDQEIEERDIAWFVLDETSLQSNYRGQLGLDLLDHLMETYFRPLPEESAVLLIGKDGYIKSRSADLHLERLFENIDSMPMRREEIRRRSTE